MNQNLTIVSKRFLETMNEKLKWDNVFCSNSRDGYNNIPILGDDTGLVSSHSTTQVLEKYQH